MLPEIAGAEIEPNDNDKLRTGVLIKSPIYKQSHHNI